MVGEPRHRRAGSIAALGIAACLGALSCQPEGTTTTGSLTTSVSAAPKATASAEPAATKPSQPQSPQTGSWIGSYETAKGKVDVPAGVSYPIWTKDDGTLHSGKGTVELTVAADGVVSGKVDGALGALTVAGVVESDWLRAGLTPAKPDGVNLMTGVLIGEVKGSQIDGSLRLANHDGSVVRVGKLTLKPRP
jgi:hypothetical protein